MENNQNTTKWYSLAGIWFGGIVSVPALLVGSTLIASLRFNHSIWAGLIGFSFVVLFMSLLSIAAVEKRKATMDKVFSFLEIEKEHLDIDLNSNKASEARFIWVKNLMKKTGFWRIIFKNLIPSLKIRQIIKNRLQRVNTNEYTPKALSQTDKKDIFEKYFKQDVEALEKLIGKKMNWNL